MLALAFFISVFSTLTWLIFSAAYINDHLGGVAFGALGITDISVYLALILLPILVCGWFSASSTSIWAAARFPTICFLCLSK